MSNLEKKSYSNIISSILTVLLIIVVVIAWYDGMYIRSEVQIIETCNGLTTNDYDFVIGGEHYVIPEGKNIRDKED